MPPRKSNPRPNQDVDPRWLLKALALSLLAAVTLGYLSVCLLIYQGGWQRFLTPSTAIDATPNFSYTPIRFDATVTGQPRLTAWWIQSDSSTAPIILYLHDGDGSLSSALPRLHLLQRAGLNIFAIDYRGFGQSDPTHPNEARMTEDAEASFRYLTDIRHIAPSQIIPYGEGLGAVFASRLAAQHTQIPALILDSPHPYAYQRVLDDPRSRFLPTRLLLRDHFDLTQAVTGVTQPKLLIANGLSYDGSHIAENEAYFRTLPDPKFTVTFGHDADLAYLTTLHRFLDENLPPSGVSR
jgi:pimeloyl-ACP methyl ester carboxylesterase